MTQILGYNQNCLCKTATMSLIVLDIELADKNGAKKLGVLLTDKNLDIPSNLQHVFNQHSKHIGAQISCTKLIGEAVLWTEMTLQRF